MTNKTNQATAAATTTNALKVVVIYDGDLGRETAEKFEKTKPSGLADVVEVTLRHNSEQPDPLTDSKGDDANATVVCFIVQAIEKDTVPKTQNVLRFYKRKKKTLPSIGLPGSSSSGDSKNGDEQCFKYAVLGLGDEASETPASKKDCDHLGPAEKLDKQLTLLGGSRQCPMLGAAGPAEVEPWIRDVFWKSVVGIASDGMKKA